MVVHLDNALVHSNEREERLQHLRHVCRRKREQPLFAKLSKCDIATQGVQYLGLVIEHKGVSADPDKLDTIRSCPEILHNRKPQRGLLGVVFYYRRLIRNFKRLTRSTASSRTTRTQSGAHNIHKQSGILSKRTWMVPL